MVSLGQTDQSRMARFTLAVTALQYLGRCEGGESSVYRRWCPKINRQENADDPRRHRSAEGL